MFLPNFARTFSFFLAFACVLPSGVSIQAQNQGVQKMLKKVQHSTSQPKDAQKKKNKTWQVWFAQKVKRAKKFYKDNSFVFKLFAGIFGASVFGWYAVPRLFYDWTTTTIGNSQVGVYKRECTDQQQAVIPIRDTEQAPEHNELGRVYVNRENREQLIYRVENEQDGLIGYQDEERNIVAQRPEHPLPAEDEQTDEANQLRQAWDEWRAFVNATELAQRRVVRQINYNLPNATIFQPQVVPQAGDSCAYHALKNTALILNEVRNPQGNLAAQLRDQQVVARDIGTPDNPGSWRQMFIDSNLNRPAQDQANQPRKDRQGNIMYPNGDPNGENINDAALDLIKNNDDTIPDDIQVITAVTIGRPAADLVCPHVAQELQNAQGEYSKGFVINLGRHWVSAVVHKDAENNIVWYTSDSYKNTSRLNSPSINRLIGVVSGQQPQAEMQA